MRAFQKTLRFLQQLQAARLQSGLRSSDSLTHTAATFAPVSSNTPATFPAEQHSYLETLRAQLSTEEGCAEFLRAAGSTPSPSNAPAVRVPERSSTAVGQETSLRAGSFLEGSAVPVQAALAVAVELLARPDTPVSTLRSCSGIKRRKTLVRLVRLIRDADRRGDDRVLLALRRSLQPP